VWLGPDGDRPPNLTRSRAPRKPRRGALGAGSDHFLTIRA